jgi:hypothetical protein
VLYGVRWSKRRGKDVKDSDEWALPMSRAATIFAATAGVMPLCGEKKGSNTSSRRRQRRRKKGNGI